MRKYISVNKEIYNGNQGTLEPRGDKEGIFTQLRLGRAGVTYGHRHYAGWLIKEHSLIKKIFLVNGLPRHSDWPVSAAHVGLGAASPADREANTELEHDGRTKCARSWPKCARSWPGCWCLLKDLWFPSDVKETRYLIQLHDLTLIRIFESNHSRSAACLWTVRRKVHCLAGAQAWTYSDCS